MTGDVEGMAVFAAVAESKSLREAGERLGVSGSAVSQSLRKLEERLGVALVQRTTRSLRLTDAGEQLYASVGPALAEMRAAAAAVGELGSEPGGTLRLLIAPAAEALLSGDFLAPFANQYPRIRLDFFVSYEPLDIVAERFDAGIRPGEVIDKDMIAVPASDDIHVSVVGSASYFARHRKPKHPRELVEHECIGWHPTANAPPLRWDFTENGRDFSVDVGSRINSNDPALNLRLVRAGLGLTLADHRVVDDSNHDDLVEVLREFMTSYPGLYLYYPQRRHVSPALRAFIDYLRDARRSPSRPKPQPTGSR
jgi:DNA-binding transcriptional LysR family regulator